MNTRFQDVRATPTSVQFNDAPRSYQVENFAIGLENPIDVEAVKHFFANSIMLKLPRFTSLLVKHGNRGSHYWKSTQVNIDQHFVLVRHNHGLNEEETEDTLNGYLTEMAQAPILDALKPLWEIHMLVDLRVLVLRVHHAIGDGASMASLIREIGRSENGEKMTTPPRALWKRGGGCFKSTLYTMVFAMHFFVKLFLVRDKTVLNAKSYAHNWPQKLATTRFVLEDVKLVKKLVPKATINDIFCGVVWSGFMKYVNAHSSTALKEGQQITGMVAVNMRERSGLMDIAKLMRECTLESFWGNKSGFFLLPLSYTKDITDPVDYARKAKYILDKKKSSMEASMLIILRNLLLRFCGQKVLTDISTRSCINTTFLFSNVVGPSEQISIADNPVNYIRLSCSSSPMGIVMHLMSYKNNLDMQILAAEDVIPDAKFLANCFQDAFKEMKTFVNLTTNSS